MGTATPISAPHRSGGFTNLWSRLGWFIAASVSIFLGAALWIIVPEYREQAARREIQRVGGRVEIRSWSLSSGGSPPFLEVDLEDSRATDHTLTYLETLPAIESLLLNNTAVTDVGLRHVEKLTSLKNLRLSGTRVTDSGLSHLTGLGNLQMLSLDHTQVSDAGAASLRQLTSLAGLLVSDTKITDKGLAELRLALPGTEIVVDRSLAVPPSQVPAESPIVRFRFRHTRSRVQTREGFKDLPETNFGELLIERKTRRSVYRYWYDGVHEFPPNWRRQPDDGERQKDQARDSLFLKRAAGFDGKRCWLASFNKNQPMPHADRLDVYNALPHGAGDVWRQIRVWLDSAPLHQLAAALGSNEIERDKVHRALRAFTQGKKHGPYAQSITVDGWNYIVALDNSELGVRRIDVQLAGGWAGAWPYPVPPYYSMERENVDGMDAQRFDSLIDLSTYIDESTVVAE